MLILAAILASLTLHPQPASSNSSDHLAASATTIPAPTGPHRIGTTIYQFADSSRTDRIAPLPRRYRTIVVQLWYPTDANRGARAPYIPDRALLAAMRSAGYYDTDSATIMSWAHIDTHALLNVAPARSEPLPLIIFSEGQGVARSNYTTFIEDLASHGYIVAAIDHPYGGFTVLDDGRVLTAASDTIGGDSDEAEARRVDDWARDDSLVLSRLTSGAGEPALVARSLQPDIDAARVGAMGHSLGGAAAFEMCRRDSRIRACVNMDGAMFGTVADSGIGRPVLMLRSHPDYSDADLAKRGRTRKAWDAMGASIKASIDSILAKRLDAPSYVVSILGTGHMSYSDAPFVMPTTITRFGGTVIDASRGFEIMSAYTRAFLDRYVRGTDGALLAKQPSPFREVVIDRFGSDSMREHDSTVLP